MVTDDVAIPTGELGGGKLGLARMSPGAPSAGCAVDEAVGAGAQAAAGFIEVEAPQRIGVQRLSLREELHLGAAVDPGWGEDQFRHVQAGLIVLALQTGERVSCLEGHNMEGYL